MRKLNKGFSTHENSVEAYMHASTGMSQCTCNCGGTYWMAEYYANLSTH